MAKERRAQAPSRGREQGGRFPSMVSGLAACEDRNQAQPGSAERLGLGPSEQLPDVTPLYVQQPRGEVCRGGGWARMGQLCSDRHGGGEKGKGEKSPKQGCRTLGMVTTKRISKVCKNDFVTREDPHGRDEWNEPVPAAGSRQQTADGVSPLLHKHRSY